eukprot:CAMPEP_0184691296 /NCGR_PEP_ID=MMETSP0313-20130426/186_1 /TAXON_ID=2792 /ORGANISM="Porphyridium aerugineum, Strain SAG 1380-2" /LENGTH=156 /DNA_ID=CAMNT_0027148979 /DNA_START=95 /DNA_END=565 /DNA_ORIENTATION=-
MVSVKVPKEGYGVAPAITAQADVEKIITDFQPKSWISLLTDDEASKPNANFIEKTVKAKKVEFQRIPVKTSLIGKDEKDDAELAKFLMDAIKNAPKPVVIQCASGKRAGAAFSVCNVDQKPYTDVLAEAKAHDLAWVGSPAMENFVHDNLGKQAPK